ncbi:MAG TPA: glycosyltransferase family 9 protein [Steroidobacteraceae bacterium]|jgi:heptosyltransferase I
MPSFAEPPRSICILRLSAIGDACHVVPIVRTLQQAWPSTQLTWIIGKTEARLMTLLEGVEFIIVDKRATAAARREQRMQLKERRFDVLLHMQLALRASLVARSVPAAIKVGFDRARARELQWLFTDARIATRVRQHVLDSFFGFTEALGVTERVLRWDLPLPPAAQEYAQQLIPEDEPTLVISPCSSHTLRNWMPERYAAVAEHAIRCHGMRVILAGGPTELERAVGAQIEARCGAPLVNQVGKDTLPQLLALLARARVLVTPDSGPAHMATMVGTPVIGLYAATNPARSGPYLSGQWCVNAYPEAARTFRGVEPEQLPWTHKIEEPGVMELIRVDQVLEKLDALANSP